MMVACDATSGLIKAFPVAKTNTAKIVNRISGDKKAASEKTLASRATTTIEIPMAPNPTKMRSKILTLSRRIKKAAGAEKWAMWRQ